MINKKIKKPGLPTQKGFTLIETLIAVLVLMVAITGPLTLAEKGLHTTIVAKDQDTAFYLAGDAMEFVRWVRDTNKLRGTSWLNGLNGVSNGHTTPGSGSCTGANVCIVDSLRDTVTTCSSSPCPPINYDSTNNNFTNAALGSGVIATIFTRSVTITTPVSGNAAEAIVTVAVTWYDQGSLQRTVTVRENLFDWQ